MNPDDYTTWSRKAFLKLPFRESWDKEVKDLDAIVLLPMRHKHDSGFSCMDFIAIRDGKPICRLSGCSDVVHIDGIGAILHQEKQSWSIDCLYPSGLMRIFCMNEKVVAGMGLSSFELFARRKQGR